MNGQQRQIRQGMQNSAAGSNASQPQTPRYRQQQQIPFYQDPQNGDIEQEDNTPPSYRNTPASRQSLTRRSLNNVPNLGLNPNPNHGQRISPDISPRSQFQSPAAPRKLQTPVRVQTPAQQQDVTPQISPRRANAQQFNMSSSPTNTANSRSVNFSPNQQVQHYEGTEDEGYSEFSHEDYVGDDGAGSDPSSNPILFVPDGQSQGQGKSKGLGMGIGQGQMQGHGQGQMQGHGQGHAQGHVQGHGQGQMQGHGPGQMQGHGQEGLGKPQGQIGPVKVQGATPVTRNNVPNMSNRPMGIMANQSAAETNQYMMPQPAVSPRARHSGQIGMAPQSHSPTQRMSLEFPPQRLSAQQQQLRMSAPMSNMGQYRGSRSSYNRGSRSISPPRRSVEQQQSSAYQGAQIGSPPQMNRYLATGGPRVSVISSGSYPSQQPFPVRSSLNHGSLSMPSTSVRPNVRNKKNEYRLSVAEVFFRLCIAIVCAIAFCVMVTNTVWINDEAMSYSAVGSFRYLAGVTAVSFIFCLIQLGGMLSRKLKSQTTGLEVKRSKAWLIISMLLDQVFAYLLLSCGSASLSALLYIPDICHSGTVSLTVFCHRSTLSVVATLVGFFVYTFTAFLTAFRLYKKHFQKEV